MKNQKLMKIHTSGRGCLIWFWAIGTGTKTNGDGQNTYSVYKPIPRDRDQVFAKFDGVLLKYLLQIPATRHIQDFYKEQANLKWLNRSGNVLDLVFLNRANKQMWVEQAQFIQQNLTDEVIENAFAHLPKELQDDTSNDVIAKIKKRRNLLHDWAAQRYDMLQKQVVLTGTDKMNASISFVVQMVKRMCLSTE